MTTLEVIRTHVGPCREWIADASRNCGKPADFILWGRLIPKAGLGPRCRDHAVYYIGAHAVDDPSGHAIVSLGHLVRDIEAFAYHPQCVDPPLQHSAIPRDEPASEHPGPDNAP